MERSGHGTYKLTPGVIFTLVLFGLMLTAILVLVAILLAGAVRMGGLVSDSLDPDNLSEMASGIISQDDVSAAFKTAMQDPATQKVLSDVFLAGMLAGSGGGDLAKRDLPTAPGDVLTALKALIQDPETQKALRDILKDVMQDTIIQKALSDVLKVFIQDPATQRALSDVFLTGMLEEGGLTKRDTPQDACHGIGDEQLCNVMRNTCSRLYACASTHNQTICAAAQRGAFAACTLVNVH